MDPRLLFVEGWLDRRDKGERKGGIVCRESEIMIVSDLRSKILLLGKTQISLVFHSLNRIFAA